MKKLSFCIVFFLVAVLCMAGCADEDKPADESAKNPYEDLIAILINEQKSGNLYTDYISVYGTFRRLNSAASVSYSALSMMLYEIIVTNNAIIQAGNSLECYILFADLKYIKGINKNIIWEQPS